MSKEERLLKFENELNFGIEAKDGTFYVPKDDVIKAASGLLDEVQPQLTIPKSIADLLDKFIEIDFDDVGHEDWWIQENGLIEWFSKTPNCYIKDAYLNPLTRDLVKVVEG